MKKLLGFLIIALTWSTLDLVGQPYPGPSTTVISNIVSTTAFLRTFNFSMIPQQLMTDLDASAITGHINGDSITNWPDTSGNGNNATNTGTILGKGAPTYVTNFFGPLPGLLYINSILETTPFFDASFDTNFTIFIVAQNLPVNFGHGQFIIGTNDIYWFDYSPSGIVVNGFSYSGGTGGGLGPQYGGTISGTNYFQSSSRTTDPINNNRAYIQTFRLTPKSALSRINGFGVSENFGGDNNVNSLTGVPLVHGPIVFGWDQNGSRSQVFAEVLVFRGVVSDADCLLVERYLENKWRVATGPYLIYAGDSHIADSGNTVQYSNICQLVNLQLPTLTNTYDQVNVAAGSVAAFQVASNLASSVLSGIKSRNDIIVFGMGGNETNRFKLTWQVAYSNIVLACTIARSSGAQVILEDLMPQGTDLVYEGFRSNINVLERANWPAYADRFVDFDQIANLNFYMAATNTTYFLGDKVHLTYAGDTLVAPYLAAAIQSVIGGPYYGAAPITIPFPATTVPWTNVFSKSVQLYIDNSGVTGTAFKKNGATIFSGISTNMILNMQQGDYFSETYSAGSPTAKWSPF